MANKIFALVIAFLLSACAGLPPFPTKKVWETDTTHNLCVEYQILDPKTLKVKKLKDWPISKCDGIFGFQPEDAGHVFTWSRNAIKQCENCAQRAQQLETLLKERGQNVDSTLTPCADESASDNADPAARP